MTSLAAAVVALYLHKKDLSLWNTAFVLVLAILLYSLGTTLDVIVFDPFYGLAPSGPIKRAWRFIACLIFSPIKFVVDKLPGTKEMAGYRKAATAELCSRINGSPFKCEKDEDCSGIYSSARTLLEGTPEWNDHVSPGWRCPKRFGASYGH